MPTTFVIAVIARAITAITGNRTCNSTQERFHTWARPWGAADPRLGSLRCRSHSRGLVTRPQGMQWRRPSDANGRERTQTDKRVPHGHTALGAAPWRGRLPCCGPRRGGASTTAAAAVVRSAVRSAVRWRCWWRRRHGGGDGGATAAERRWRRGRRWRGEDGGACQLVEEDEEDEEEERGAGGGRAAATALSPARDEARPAAQHGLRPSAQESRTLRMGRARVLQLQHLAGVARLACRACVVAVRRAPSAGCQSRLGSAASQARANA